MNRSRLFPLVSLSLLVTGVSCTPPTSMVYSAGFSFSKYDFLVFGKPEGGQTTALYGMDVEVANLMARYNMTIVGDKEFVGMKSEDKTKTLFVRFAISTFNKQENLITISFDDAISGKTVANLTSQAKGNMFSPTDRTKALEIVSKPLSESLTNEKGLQVNTKK